MANPTSITDYLSGLGKDSSFGARQKLAQQYGINDYSGNAQQNTLLLGILQGQGGNTNTNPYQSPAPKNYTPAPKTPVAPVVQSTPTSYPWTPVTPNYTPKPAVTPSVPQSTETSYPWTPVQQQSQPQNFTPIPTLNASQAKGKITEAGLSGTGINSAGFVGLTNDEAAQRIAAERDRLQSLTSQNTSYALNPDFFNKASSSMNKYQIGLKEAFTDPWATSKDKEDKKNKLIDTTATEIGSMISSPQMFDSLYSSDAQFKSLIDSFTAQGGSVDAIKSKIPQQAAGATVVSDVQNPDGTRTVSYADGTKDIMKQTVNADGSVSYTPSMGTQLTTGNPLIDKLLAPQTEMVQANVDYLKTIPEQYRQLYFGDTGYFTQQRKDAEAALEKLNQSYQNVETATSGDFEAQRQKNEQQANVELATIEENRANNQNYITGMLAKLGALITTGEAPAAVAKLNQKYDQLSTNVRQNLNSAQATLASEKAKVIAGLEQERLGKVAAIKSDISKSSFEIQKEIMTVENNTRQAIQSAILDWQKQAAAINKSFIDKANAQSKTYQDLYMKAISSGITTRMLADIKKNLPITAAEASTYGVPYGTTYGQLEGKTLGKPLTGAQAQAATYAQRMIDAEKIFSDPNGGDKVFSSINPAYLGILVASQEPSSGFIGNIASQAAYSQIPEALKQQFQAQRSFINAILRKESGAAISASEFDSGIKQYFPQPGDTAAVIAQKKANREAALKGVLSEAGQTGFERYQNVQIPGAQQPTQPTNASEWTNW